MPEAVTGSQTLTAELDSAATLETIKVREFTPMLVMEESLALRDSSHWGIKE